MKKIFNQKNLSHFVAFSILTIGSIFIMGSFSQVEANTSSPVFKNPFGAKNNDDIWAFVLAIVDFILNVALAVVVLFMIYAGFMFITAQGKEEALNIAKKNLWGAVIGALLIMGAKALAFAICNTAVSVGLVKTQCKILTS
jgi:amino acid transporter